MRLSEITLSDVKNDFEVSKLCLDSRKCEDNSVFFAVQGSHQNGENFIPMAIENGAKAIVVRQDYAQELSEEIELIKTYDVKKTLADLCQRFYTDIPENLCAVTGTNGKTSVACFVANIIAKLGEGSASIGTLGTLLDGDFDRRLGGSGLTTPDLITLYETLSELKQKNINYVCIETSSHGLQQGRVGNLLFKAAGFLNLTQDHLDYHKTMKEYLQAKSLLFTEHMQSDGIAVLNADISEFSILKPLCKSYIDFGRDARSLRIDSLNATDHGLEISINDNLIKTKLIGDFQGYNLACAIGLVKSLGFGVDEIVSICQNINSVRGRMEVFEIGGAKAIVDYAHTPDALEKAIVSLKPHTTGRIITIFGCGGDRDKEKRPLMGEIACKYSDIAIITDDNPRTEEPDQIRLDIKKGCTETVEIGDRRKAIIYGLEQLQEGDSLLVAGKGHEDYQIIGDKKIHFSDAEVIKEYLETK